MRGSLGIMKIVLKMKKKSLLFSFECMKLHEISIKTTDFYKIFELLHIHVQKCPIS